jgi:hypothetical protein
LTPVVVWRIRTADSTFFRCAALFIDMLGRGAYSVETDLNTIPWWKVVRTRSARDESSYRETRYEISGAIWDCKMISDENDPYRSGGARKVPLQVLILHLKYYLNCNILSIPT